MRTFARFVIVIIMSTVVIESFGLLVKLCPNPRPSPIRSKSASKTKCAGVNRAVSPSKSCT